MRHLSIALACLLAMACGTPSDAEGWAKRAARRSRTDEKLHALDQVRKAPGDRRAAVPHLLEILKQAPRVRGKAAVVLGEIGDAAAIPGLVAAVDPAARDRDGIEANRDLAGALGLLRAKEAVPVLRQLTASTDGYTQVAASTPWGSSAIPPRSRRSARSPPRPPWSP
jgi:HEAT repeat protein